MRNYQRTLIIVAALILLFLITWAAYLRIIGGRGWAEWTGIGESIKVIIPPTPELLPTPISPIVEYRPAKTLWDFSVILLGGVLALLLAVFNKQIQDRRKHTDIEIANDRQKEEALQSYLIKIEELFLDRALLETKDDENSVVRAVAQVQTITTLRNLDTDRQNIVIQFLRDSELGEFILINASLQKISLTKADLFRINLMGANLTEANLTGANLWKTDLMGADLWKTDLMGAFLVEANLRRAKLSEANLSEANLWEADLKGAYLSGVILSGAILSVTDLSEANLSGVILIGADLSETDLGGANLGGANLSEANLWEANLWEANLRGADLRGADLTNANLMEANLTEANLTGAEVTTEQLMQAKSLEGAIMPNGTQYDGRFDIEDN